MVLILAAVVAPETAAAQVNPTRLQVGSSTQVITVESATWSTSYATVQAWEKVGGRWVKPFGAMRARIGRNGFVRDQFRRQNTGTTPAGNYRISFTFGQGADPDTRMPYRNVDATDYWVYDPADPATYNTLQPFHSRSSRWRIAEAERLAAYGKQYKWAAVINYNLPPNPDVRKGGGIFLHINGRGATAGCVSVYPQAMAKLMLWLDANAQPRIVMAPRSYLPAL